MNSDRIIMRRCTQGVTGRCFCTSVQCFTDYVWKIWHSFTDRPAANYHKL